MYTLHLVQFCSICSIFFSELYSLLAKWQDPKRTGRVKIRDLLTSQILPELYELRQEQPLGDAENNWFSMQSALKALLKLEMAAKSSHFTA